MHPQNHVLAKLPAGIKKKEWNFPFGLHNGKGILDQHLKGTNDLHTKSPWQTYYK